MEERSHSEHDFYKTGDPDVPDCVTDGHGEVVLQLCRRCGLGEIDLVGKPVCIPRSDFGIQPTPWQQVASAPRAHSNDNPLWQGPCGQGWNGGVTQSMLSNFFSCRERFRLKYVLGLMPHDRWHHTFGYGNMWHACEEALANDCHDAAILRVLHKHTREMMDRYPHQREDLVKWANVCAVQFPEYIKYWQEHPDVQNRTPLLQEQVFDVPYTLPSGRVVRLRGKWDSVDLIQEETDIGDGKILARQGIWLQENKTKGDIDRVQVERQLKFDLQTMLYTTALTTDNEWVTNILKRPVLPHGWNNYSILGVRYNVVRRPLSGGKGNIKPHSAKTIKGKFIPAETDEEFYERLRRDYIAKEPDYWFFRVRAGISAEDVRVFRETCLDPLLEQLCQWYDQIVGNPCHWKCSPWMNYRTPFGIWSALEEGGATEYDHYMESGSEATLRRVTELFSELKS